MLVNARGPTVRMPLTNVSAKAFSVAKAVGDGDTSFNASWTQAT